ncbi:MAG TPA: SpoIIE family protein phosphatase [Terriglobales bacterium]|nr:SpoIIE family protein phosphatase [Terriglobales bacterium]
MASVLGRYSRRRIAELAPRTTLGRIALYLLVLDLALYIADKVVSLVSTAAAASSGLGGWVSFLTFILLLLASILAFRWMREKLLWRLRNRLIVTYVFIGVIPVLLIATIAVGAGYLFAGQFATYLATSDIQAELRSLEAANSTIAAEYAHSLSAGEQKAALPALHDARMENRWAGRQVTAWYGERATLLQGPPGASALPRPAWAKEDFRSVAFDAKGVYLRVATTVTAAGKPLTVVSSEPLDAARLQEITANFAEVTLTEIGSRPPDKQPDDGQSGFRISRPDPDQKGVRLTVSGETPASVRMPKVTAGSLPAPAASLDPEFSFISLFPVTDWSDGTSHTEGLIVHSRLSALYGRLFRTLGQLTQIIIYAIAGTAVFFAIIELFALFIGLGLARTITKSVAELYKGTQHVNRGDFSYRIPVRSKDQLAALETSFNSMSESLERLMAEQKEKQRLENELAIAQEVQAQLFPKQTTEMESLEVFGICQPARTVSGDYYDFLPLGPERLGIAVGDISGKGISAALLMATVHSAIRAYEFGRMPAVTGRLVAAGSPVTHVLEMTSGAPPDNGFSPASVLSVLNRQLYHSTPLEKYATLFLSVYNARTRTLNYSNAGHLPPIIIRKDRSIRRLDTAGLVVGLFDAQTYGEESVALAPGEIFLAYSDGVTEPENEFGEFGEERLIEIVRDHRHLPLSDIGGLVTSAVKEWIGSGEQPDDITIVLARPR